MVIIYYLLLCFTFTSGFRQHVHLRKILKIDEDSISSFQVYSGNEVLDASYHFALLCSGTGLCCFTISKKWIKGVISNAFGVLGFILIFLGSYAAMKTYSCRLYFDNSEFAIIKRDGSSIGLNPVVGGEYRWEYKKVVNYRLFPSNDIPLILYFKEISTPPSARVEPPFIVDSIPGQVHVFPVIGDPIELKDNLKKSRLIEIPRSSPISIQTDLMLFIRGLQLI